MNEMTLTRHNSFLSRPNKAEIGPEKADAAVEHFIRESLSHNTRAAYRADLSHFMAWGGVLPATADLVARYLADHADTLAPASLARRVTMAAFIAEVEAALPEPRQA